MPSLLHILKMMMNVVATLQPIAEYSTLFSLLSSTPLLLMFFSIIPLPLPTFICAHSFALPFPLLFTIVFQLHYSHSVMNSKTSKTSITSNNKCKLFLRNTPFFSSLNIPLVTFIFSSACRLLINTWSLKLIWPIITNLCVPCTAMCKHLASSLWMNFVDFIFRLFHIRNFPTLSILIPFRSPYTPSAKCAHLSTNYENTYGDCTNFSIDYAHNSNDCVNTLDDRVNTVVDSADMLDISSLNFCIPNLTPL